MDFSALKDLSIGVVAIGAMLWIVSKGVEFQTVTFEAMNGTVSAMEDSVIHLSHSIEALNDAVTELMMRECVK